MFCCYKSKLRDRMSPSTDHEGRAHTRLVRPLGLAHPHPTPLPGHRLREPPQPRQRVAREHEDRHVEHLHDLRGAGEVRVGVRVRWGGAEDGAGRVGRVGRGQRGGVPRRCAWRRRGRGGGGGEEGGGRGRGRAGLEGLDEELLLVGLKDAVGGGDVVELA